jgi:nucleoid DNA-binding protein
MNKLDLIAAVAQETDISKAKAAEVVEAVFGAIEKSLKQKEEVRLVVWHFRRDGPGSHQGPQSAHG